MKHSFTTQNNCTCTRATQKTILIWIVSFFALTAAELFLLSVVSLIPRSAIQKHAQESAVYFMKRPVFYRVLENDPASNIDHYADAILLNVLYYYDAEHPFASPLKASYYYTSTHNENTNLYTAVTSDAEPTYDYFRYWHGSAVLIRPLLTIFNIQQIYIVFAIVLAGLLAALVTMLAKSGHAFCIWGILTALISVSFCYIPMSLEYIWCFFIMLLASILTLSIYKKKKGLSGLFFLLIGNITAYFDFLTTEMITLLVPLALLLIFMYENDQLKDVRTGFRIIFSRSICWGIGYLSAWIAKWSITSITLHRNIFKEAISSASVRVNGNASDLHGISLAINALLRNIACLFPFNYVKNHGYAVSIGVFVLLFMIYYLFRKSEKKNFMPWLFMALYCIPYIRFLILANHTFLHYFFTYRALFASIFCLCMIFYYGIDRKLVSKSFSTRKRKKRTR